MNSGRNTEKHAALLERSRGACAQFLRLCGEIKGLFDDTPEHRQAVKKLTRDRMHQGHFGYGECEEPK